MSPRRLALAVLACFAAATAPASAHDDGPLVDLALTASASAPAVNDGNAATTACGSDSVTVDLGRPRRLEGFGVSLAGDGATARVSIEAAGRRVAATVPVGDAGLAARPPPAGRPHRAAAHRRRRVRRRAARPRPRPAVDDRRPRPLASPSRRRRPAPPTPIAAAPRCPSRSSPPTAPTGCACACGSIRPPATATCRACSRWRAARRPPACASCSIPTTRTSGPIRRSSRSRPRGRRTCPRWPPRSTTTPATRSTRCRPRARRRRCSSSAGAGTPNDNLTLFDFSGHALPGVSFADPLRACAGYAPALAGACAR